ncbi:hypothetical protein ACQP1W_42665 [Spirillospora sp. CA-255316]
MTESPPRPEMPSDEVNVPPGIPYGADEAGGAAEPAEAFIMPPAPLPVAPWWASSTPDPTPPPSVTSPPVPHAPVAHPPVTITDPIPVGAEPPAVPAGPPVDLVTAPPPDPAAVVAGPPPPVEVLRETLPPVPVEAEPSVPAARPPAPVEMEAVPVVPLEVAAVPEAPPQPPSAPAEPPAAPPVPSAPPAAPDTLVDQVISTGPQPSVAVQDLPAWHASDSHWTPSPPLAAPQAAAPPPVPPNAVQAPPGPSAPGATPRKRPKAPLMALLAVGAGVAAAAVAAVLVAVSGGDEVPLRKVAAGGTAGGLRKDASVPAMSAAYPFIIAAARSGGVEQAVTARGVYRDPATGAQNILFLGGTAPIGDPTAFLKKARPSTALTAAATVPGKAGGQVSCGTFAVLAETHLYCAWATENSFGFVASNEPAGAAQPSALAPLTLRMRADLEKRSS